MELINPLLGSIIVSCETNQKEEALIGGNLLKTGKNYNENFRERNPVVAFVVNGTKEIPQGSHIICNYSHFDLESPYEYSKGMYSIPVDEEIYAIVNTDGNLTPVCGNVLVEKIMRTNRIDIPEDFKKEQINQGIALTGEYKGQRIFWLPFSNYTICYNWNDEERTAIKIYEKEITGCLK